MWHRSLGQQVGEALGKTRWPGRGKPRPYNAHRQGMKGDRVDSRQKWERALGCGIVRQAIDARENG